MRRSSEVICASGEGESGSAMSANRGPSVHAALSTCQSAGPIGTRNIDRPNPQSMPLRIFHDRRWMIKTHGLIVQKGCGKRCQVMTFEICARIGQQRKTSSVRFREAVERKRDYGLHNLI